MTDKETELSKPTEMKTNDIKDVLGLDDPWPLISVLKTLINASNELLHRYNYDKHGYEEIQICIERGKEIIELLSHPLTEQIESKAKSEREKCGHQNEEICNTCSILNQINESKERVIDPEWHDAVVKLADDLRAENIELKKQMAEKAEPQAEQPKEKKQCPNCKETINPCACMRNVCIRCGKPVGNITFTICDVCWDKLQKKRL